METTTKRERVYPVEIRLYCAVCDCEMERLPAMLLTNPPQFQFKCPGWCDDATKGTVVALPEPYPRVVYEKLEGDDDGDV